MTRTTREPGTRRLQLVSPSREDGGVETYLRTMTAGMIDRAYSVEVGLPDGPATDALRADLRRLGAAVSHLRYQWREPRSAREALGLFVRELLASGSVYLRSRSDATFTMLPHPDLAPGLVLAAALRRRRSVVIVHLVPPDIKITRARRALYSLARLGGQQWVCVSQNNADVLTKAMSWRSGSIATVYNGVPTFAAPTVGRRLHQARALRASLGLPSDTRIMLTVGRLNVQKGHDLIVDGMPAVLQEVPEAHWVWAGEGAERASLLRRARALCVQDRLILLGHVSPARVRELMLGSDLLIFPSRYEGFALTVLEAHMASLPVIVSDTGSLPEMVRPDIDGAVFPGEDSDALARATIEALHRPEIGFRWAAAAGSRVRAEFSDGAMIERTLALLHQ